MRFSVFMPLPLGISVKYVFPLLLPKYLFELRSLIKNVYVDNHKDLLRISSG